MRANRLTYKALQEALDSGQGLDYEQGRFLLADVERLRTSRNTWRDNAANAQKTLDSLRARMGDTGYVFDRRGACVAKQHVRKESDLSDLRGAREEVETLHSLVADLTRELRRAGLHDASRACLARHPRGEDPGSEFYRSVTGSQTAQ